MWSNPFRSFSHSSLRLSTKITRWRIGKDPFPSACDSCASCFAVSRWPHPAGFFKGTIMLPSIRWCGQILHLFFSLCVSAPQRENSDCRLLPRLLPSSYFIILTSSFTAGRRVFCLLCRRGLQELDLAGIRNIAQQRSGLPRGLKGWFRQGIALDK